MKRMNEFDRAEKFHERYGIDDEMFCKSSIFRGLAFSFGVALVITYGFIYFVCVMFSRF